MGSRGDEPLIPSVDISAYVQKSSSPEEKRRAVKEFADKCKRNGCLKITGHGIPIEIIRKNFDLARSFYALPTEEKQKAPHPEGFMPHRGYSGVGGEKAALKTMYNLDEEGNRVKGDDGEHFKISITNDGNKEQTNIYPPEDVIPGFREITTEFYWRLAETGLQLLDIMLDGLELPKVEAKAIHDIHSDGQYNHLRTLHYFPIPAGKAWAKDESRLGAHCDLGTFTFGFQTAGGLDYLDRQTDTWLPVEFEEAALHLNMGEMITRFTNGRIPGGMHRVTAPPPGPDGTVPERFSVAYFVSTSFATTIATAKSLIERDGGEVRYPSMTLGEYVSTAF